jgi:hypothetical protein
MPPNATTWEGRRALTDSPATSPETFRLAGRELLDLNQPAEAVDFFARAGDEEGLRAVLARAVEEGHFFLFLAAAAKLPPPPPAEVRELLENAEKNGLTLYAAKARDYLAALAAD